MPASNQIIPSGSYNNVGADYLSPIAAGPIQVLDAAAGTAYCEFDSTNKRFAVDKIEEFTAAAGITLVNAVHAAANETLDIADTTNGFRNVYCASINRHVGTMSVAGMAGVVINTNNTDWYTFSATGNLQPSTNGTLDFGDTTHHLNIIYAKQVLRDNGTLTVGGSNTNGALMINTAGTDRLAMDSSGYLAFQAGYAAGSSTKNPAVDAAAGWVPIKTSAGATVFLPYYAA